MKVVIPVASFILAVSIMGFGCAKPAPSSAPTPPVATVAKPSLAPKPAPTTAPSSKTDPLAQIIEGAKKEGTVSVALVGAFTAAPLVQKLKGNIKQKYGVDLDIKVAAPGNMAAMLAKAVMEYKTGAPPAYDIMSLGSDYIPQGIKEGVFEKVDWKSLLPANTPAGIIPENPLLFSGPVLNSDATGLIYNPKKVTADQAPKKLNDLADPKWKGRLGIMSYPAYWTRWAFIMGKDKTIATLRAILKNQPILGEIDPLNNRYLVGEIDIVFTSSGLMITNRDKGMPTEFAPLDILEMRDYQLSVVKNATHPNAAKLLAVYFASQDGVNYVIKDVKKSHIYYPGSHVYDTVVQSKKDGIPVVTLDNSPKLLDFILSPEYAQWQKEIELIIKQGG